MNILLADDHVLFRDCVRSLLEAAGNKVVGEASNGVDTMDKLASLKPDAIVLDINMPVLNGMEVASAIRQRGLATKIIMLTMYDEDNSFLEAFRLGVNAYVLKTQASADLVQAVREVSKGRLYLSPELTAKLVDVYLQQDGDGSVRLSFRERQILQLVAEGTITREIAKLLNLSVKSVESHRSQLMKKLGASNIAGLVRHAVRLRVISP